VTTDCYYLIRGIYLPVYEDKSFPHSHYKMVRERRSDKNDQAEETKYLEKYTLTKAEIEIIGLIECGFSNREIAKLLSKSEQTVKFHLTNVYTKLSIKNRYQLIVCIKGLRDRYKSRP
jgi:DNA-binding NarL/FixJ family response regulator